MGYEVKGNILGFENMQNVEIIEVDEMFSTMKDADKEEISFTMINPYVLREYSFDVPTNIKVLLDIDENSNVSVYNIVVIQNPLEDSAINFLAPILVNNDNKRIGQAILDHKKHHDFGMAETISSYKE